MGCHHVRRVAREHVALVARIAGHDDTAGAGVGDVGEQVTGDPRCRLTHHQSAHSGGSAVHPRAQPGGPEGDATGETLGEQITLAARQHPFQLSAGFGIGIDRDPVANGGGEVRCDAHGGSVANPTGAGRQRCSCTAYPAASSASTTPS